MNLYRIRHVIGRDNLHRIRITSTVNGQNVGNSGEGFNDKQEAIANVGRCFHAYLEMLGMTDFLRAAFHTAFVASLNDIPTVDERETDQWNDCRDSRPQYRAADPLEPQTPEN